MFSFESFRVNWLFGALTSSLFSFYPANRADGVNDEKELFSKDLLKYICN